MKELFYLIQRRRPHLIVLNSENLDAIRLAEDIRNMLKQEVIEKRFPMEIPVEITYNDPAKVYMNSRMSTVFFLSNFYNFNLARICRVPSSFKTSSFPWPVCS